MVTGFRLAEAGARRLLVRPSTGFEDMFVNPRHMTSHELDNRPVVDGRGCYGIDALLLGKRRKQLP